MVSSSDGVRIHGWIETRAQREERLYGELIPAYRASTRAEGPGQRVPPCQGGARDTRSALAGAGPSRSLALIRLVWVAKGARLASRILTSAPSLMSSPNRSRSTQHSRASGMPWTERR